MSVGEAVSGLGKQIGKTYLVFVIGIAIAVAAAAQIRFASLGPDWMPDEERRAYVEGLLVTGATFLWIAVTLIAGAIARVALPALLTVAVSFVIFANHLGRSDHVLARSLFDSPESFLGDVGQIVIGPLLLAPAIGSLGARDLWRLLGRILRRVPRRVTAWPEYDVVEYRVQREGVVWEVYLVPNGRAGFGQSDGVSSDDGSSMAGIFLAMEPGAPGDLVRANCWACLG